MATLIKEKKVVTEAVLRAVAHVATLQRGDVIPWATLEGLAGFERYTQHWHAFISRLRKKVLAGDRGIWLAAITNVGLRLLTQKEQILDQNRTRRARRQLNRGIKEVSAVPDSGLSDHDRMAKMKRIEANRAARLMATRANRTAEVLSKTSNGIPKVRMR